MKVILAIILALVACVLAENERKQIHYDCLKEHPLFDKENAQLRKHKPAQAESEREFYLCKAIKHGVFSPETGFNVERVVDQFNPGFSREEATRHVKECIAKYHTDDKSDGQVVNEVYLCLSRKVHDFRNQKL